MSRKLTMKEICKRALNASKKAHRDLETMISGYKKGSCKIEDLKPFLDLVQQADYELIYKEAILRSEVIQNSVCEDYDKTLDQGIELNRLTALQYLKEQGVKI